MPTEEIVVAATERLFTQHDPSAVDDLFGPVYVQHSALAPDGVDGLRGLVARLTDANGYELVTVIADGELAVTQGVFTGFAPVPLVGFDVWRVQGGRIVEHWDALAPAGDHSGPGRAHADRSLTESSAALVESWVRKALVDGHVDADDPRSPDLVEHDPRPALGLDYVALHTVIADGDLVYTRAAGTTDIPVVVNDVWRVSDGRIVEHWGLVAPVPASLPHDNGTF
jgi:predicted SnoaL-like aldol condensation-catalyzing enzyme